MSKSVIVVVRHACDGGTKPANEKVTLNGNINIKNHGEHTIVDGQKITIPVNWLGDLGLRQAAALGPALNSFLEDTSKDYCPVSRIITEDTGSNNDDGTPNPLKTISYYANSTNAQQAVSFDIYQGGDIPDPNMFSIDSLLRDGIGSYSTVVCWEIKGMWRQGHGTPYCKKSILGLLGHCGSKGGKVANYEQMKTHQPFKGQIVYVFECNEDKSLTLKMYNFDVNQPVGSQFTEIKSDSPWPTNLCQDCEKHDVSQCKKHAETA
ncbi:hypothetical protein [uncultured Kordia sp.]|uniref:hypothetical protein n=1 Tax=uncultured Kordia sp. TaxID=507699 RepID=UPI002630A634|nr:hypothetical protein [uncultured Kordia sp.]